MTTDHPTLTEVVDEHRETIEALAESDLDIQLVEDCRQLLKEVDK